MTTSTEPASPPVAAQEGLRAGVLGMFDTVVMAVAGSAPAYSIAGSTAALVAAVGLAGPAALLCCGIPMLGIAWAFSYLNRVDVQRGRQLRVGRPRAAPRPRLHLRLGARDLGHDLHGGRLAARRIGHARPVQRLGQPITGTCCWSGSAWFLLMVGLVIVGVQITARAQWIMSGIEVAILVVFAVVAIVHAASHHVVAFSWSWFGFSHFSGLAGFAAGALVAAFYYWGWDVASNLNEEMKDSKRNAGIGGIIGVIIVFALFEIFTIATNLALPAKTIEANAGDVLSVLGQLVWPGLGGKLLVIAVMLSTIATLETTLIQVTRSLFAMSRERTLPKFLGSILPWPADTLAGDDRGRRCLARPVHRLELHRLAEHDPDRRHLGYRAPGLRVLRPGRPDGRGRVPQGAAQVGQEPGADRPLAASGRPVHVLDPL